MKLILRLALSYLLELCFVSFEVFDALDKDLASSNAGEVMRGSPNTQPSHDTPNDRLELKSFYSFFCKHLHTTKNDIVFATRLGTEESTLFPITSSSGEHDKVNVLALTFYFRTDRRICSKSKIENTNE